AVLSGLTVDADADLHLTVGEGEGGLCSGRQDRGRQAHAHGAGAVHGALGDPGDLIKIVATFGRGPGGLVGQHEPGDTTPGARPVSRCRGDVVSADHRGGADAVGCGQVGGDVEVVDVTAVVAVEVEHAGAVVAGDGRGMDLLG